MRTRGRLRAAVAIVLVAVLAVGLAACGDKEKSYCAALEADQEMFAAMQEDAGGLGLLTHRNALRKLADGAPDDLSDEWQTLLGAIDAFADTLHDVGVKPGDYVDGQPPPGLSEDQRTRIASAANELSSADVVEAAEEQH